MTIAPVGGVRDRSGKIVVPLDAQRSMDVGIVASFGGAAAASAVAYTVPSGAEAYVPQILITPASGSVGLIRLLDNTKPMTLPIATPTTITTSGITLLDSPTVVVPVAVGRFFSSVVVETVSGGFLPANGGSGAAFFGAVQVNILVDSKPLQE